MNNPYRINATALLEQMTLAEKIAQMGSCWIYELQTDGKLDDTKVAARFRDGIGQITRLAGASTMTPDQAARAANRLQRQLVENTRLKIPAILHEECCSGSMMLGGSVFPQIIGLASTFEPELAEKMTSEIRKQLRAVGAHQGLAPVLDIGRDPRWGRVEETFGEDPLLVSQFGVSYIRGLQGPDLKQGILATGKHFIGHSFSLGGLNCAPVQMGKRTIWDVFMLPFQAAIRDAGLASMMNAYPELDEDVVAASREILTDLLRGQLGFEGLIVSDYEAIKMIHTYHKMAPDLQEAARLALRAGIDVELPTNECYTGEMMKAVENGSIPMVWVDRSVLNHLVKKFELGLFENPYVDESRALEIFETPTQRSLAREIAQKSMVLLTNDGVLPISPAIRSLAVIGPNADSGRNMLGDYSYASMSTLLHYNKIANSNFFHDDPSILVEKSMKVDSVLEALRNNAHGVKIFHATGCDLNSSDTSGFAAAVDLAKNSDMTILVLGDRAGLTPDCTCGETRDSADLRLPGVQMDLAKQVLAAGKPVVVVLISGRPLALPDLVGQANAVLEAWLPGEEGAAAIADVLFGDVNPGGKLPITFPRSVGQVPIFYNHKPAGSTSMFYTNYVAESVEPLFPFGHGLSYSTFAYSDLSLSSSSVKAGESLGISCRVKNTGKMAGEEIVQLYLQDEFASIPRPVKELKGFHRINLDAAEEKTIIFHLPVNIMAYYDRDLALQLEAGNMKVMVGSSSQDIRLEGSFEITGPASTPVMERVYVCPVEVVND
ncbi:MAG: glycoside hydrolase family 3 N-terminal domain-containing protein [Anaerolineaceae bacterium]